MGTAGTKEAPKLIIYRYPEWGQSKNRFMRVGACLIVVTEPYEPIPALSLQRIGYFSTFADRELRNPRCLAIHGSAGL